MPGTVLWLLLYEAWVHGCSNTLFCEIFYSRSKTILSDTSKTLCLSVKVFPCFFQCPKEYFCPCRQCLLNQNTVSIQGKTIKGLGLNWKYKSELPSQSPTEVAAREATPAWARISGTVPEARRLSCPRRACAQLKQEARGAVSEDTNITVTTHSTAHCSEV